MSDSLNSTKALAIGIGVGLVSMCLQSVGMTIQRVSHVEDEAKEECDRKPCYLRRKWQIGAVVFLVPNVLGSAVQMTTLPLPVLSALNAFTLIFNAACASIMLKEPFTKYSLAGTASIICGALMISLFGAIQEPSRSLPQLLDLLGRPQFLGWLTFTAILGASVFVGSSAFQLVNKKGSRLANRATFLRGLASCKLHAITAAHALLMFKATAGLLALTFLDGQNQFASWQSWLIVASYIAFTLSQLYFLHDGLRFLSPSVLVPVIVCMNNVFVIFNGLIYYNQFSRLPTLNALMISLGVLALFVGVMGLNKSAEDNATVSLTETEYVAISDSERDSDIDCERAGVTITSRTGWLSNLRPTQWQRNVAQRPTALQDAFTDENPAKNYSSSGRPGRTEFRSVMAPHSPSPSPALPPNGFVLDGRSRSSSRRSIRSRRFLWKNFGRREGQVYLPSENSGTVATTASSIAEALTSPFSGAKDLFVRIMRVPVRSPVLALAPSPQADEEEPVSSLTLGLGASIVFSNSPTGTTPAYADDPYREAIQADENGSQDMARQAAGGGGAAAAGLSELATNSQGVPKVQIPKN